MEAIRVNVLGVWNEEQTECDGQRQEIKAMAGRFGSRWDLDAGERGLRNGVFRDRPVGEVHLGVAGVIEFDK